MKLYLLFVLRHRWAVLGIIALITLAAAASATRGVVSSSIGGLFLGEHPDYPRYLTRARDFGSDDVVIVAIAEPDPLAPDNQRRLRRAIGSIEDLPAVDAVRSILDVQQIRGDDRGLRVQTYAELARDDPDARDAILENLAADPFARGLLISMDGHHSTVIVELDSDAERPAEKTPVLIHRILAAFATAGFLRPNLHVVGLSANIAGVIEESHFSLRRLFPIVLVVLLATVWLIFRRPWPVLVTGLTALTAVIWSIGFSILLDPHVSIFTAMVPAVVLIISFSDCIHLCSAFLLELGRGAGKREAILASGGDVGAACVFTSLTTFIGFVSLSLVPTPASRLLGLVLGFGTASALLIAVTLSPILFSLLPEPKPWRHGTAGRMQDLLDRFLHWAARVSTAWPRLIVALFAALFIIASVGATRGTIQTDFAKRMSADHPLRVDGRYFREHFDGANTFEVFITAPEPGGLLEPTIMSRIARYRDDLAAMSDVNRVSSLVDLLERLHGALTTEDAGAGLLPDTRQALAQYLLLFEMSGGTELERLVDGDYQTMRMTAHLTNEEYRYTAQVGRRAAALADEVLAGAVRVEVSGLVYLLGSFFDVILAQQKRALLLLFVVIAIMMAAGLRSLRAGLWSMVPNLLPVLTLAGYIGFAWDYIDSDILMTAMIAIGIGVDDTIHFLMRYRIESRRCASPADAIERTFAYSGRGIVITTVILVAGFSPFALSDYFSMNVLGTMLPMTLVVALVADLFLLPALAELGLIRFR